jgi:hypothetical protein
MLLRFSSFFTIACAAGGGRACLGLRNASISARLAGGATFATVFGTVFGVARKGKSCEENPKHKHGFCLRAAHHFDIVRRHRLREKRCLTTHNLPHHIHHTISSAHKKMIFKLE